MKTRGEKESRYPREIERGAEIEKEVSSERSVAKHDYEITSGCSKLTQ